MDPETIVFLKYIASVLGMWVLFEIGARVRLKLLRKHDFQADIAAMYELQLEREALEYKRECTKELRTWDDEFFAVQPTDAEVLIEYFKHVAMREAERRDYKPEHHSIFAPGLRQMFMEQMMGQSQASALQQQALYQQHLNLLGAPLWQSQQSAQQSLSSGSDPLSNLLGSLGSSIPSLLGDSSSDLLRQSGKKK